MLTRKKFILIISSYALLSLVILLIAPFFGSERLGLGNILDVFLKHGTHVDADIFLFHRIPRVLLAFLVGGTLALSGCALQVVLRNP